MLIDLLIKYQDLKKQCNKEIKEIISANLVMFGCAEESGFKSIICWKFVHIRSLHLKSFVDRLYQKLRLPHQGIQPSYKITWISINIYSLINTGTGFVSIVLQPKHLFRFFVSCCTE